MTARVGHADFRIGSVAGFASELERNDARDIALQRQHLQVEHQSRVVGISRRHTDGPIQIRQRIVLRVGFGFLNAAFDFADGFKILTDARAVGRSEVAFEAREILVKPVEQAGLFPQRSTPFSAAPTFTEETLEDDSGMCLRRQRRGG